LPRNIKKLKINPIELIDKNALASCYPRGWAGELLSLRVCLGTMINNSQIEKITDFCVPFRPFTSGEAVTPGTCP
jgi:hypothetical protein